MKCRQCEDILLNYDFEDIPEKIKKEIESHLSHCIHCAELWENSQFMAKAIKSVPDVSIDEKRIPIVHSKIMDSIHREMFRESAHFNRFRIPSRLWRHMATAAAALVIGIVLGRFLSDSTISSSQIPLASASFEEMLQNQTLNDIRIREVNQSTGELVISASKKDELTLTGNITDPDIQKMLAYALILDQNPGTRLRSVKLMEGVKSSDAVQQALISSVLHDENQGVRQRALRALAQYPINEVLRNTYLSVVSKDPSPALRIEAIQILMRDEDPGTRTAVLDASEEEQNEAIQDILKRYYQEPGSTLEKQ
jgi:hypothetical protein